MATCRLWIRRALPGAAEFVVDVRLSLQEGDEHLRRRPLRPDGPRSSRVDQRAGLRELSLLLELAG